MLSYINTRRLCNRTPNRDCRPPICPFLQNAALRNMLISGDEIFARLYARVSTYARCLYQNGLKDIAEDIVNPERVLELRKLATMAEIGVIFGVKKQRVANGLDETGDLVELKHLTEEIEGGG